MELNQQFLNIVVVNTKRVHAVSRFERSDDVRRSNCSLSAAAAAATFHREADVRLGRLELKPCGQARAAVAEPSVLLGWFLCHHVGVGSPTVGRVVPMEAKAAPTSRIKVTRTCTNPVALVACDS